MLFINKIFHYLLGLVVVFLSVFLSGFVGVSVGQMVKYQTLSLSYREIAGNCALYGLCVLFAIILVLPAMYIIPRYIWPLLRNVGLKIRLFFHGY